MATDLEAAAYGLGAKPELIEYLKARGITSLTSLARFAPNQTEMTNKITRHFLDEDRRELTMHRCTEDKEVTSATMTALWEIAQQRYLMRNNAIVPASLSYAGHETSKVPRVETPTIYGSQRKTNTTTSRSQARNGSSRRPPWPEPTRY